MPKLRAVVTEMNETVHNVSLPPDSTIRKSIKYSEDWLFWKTGRKTFKSISIMKYDYKKSIWLEIARKYQNGLSVKK